MVRWSCVETRAARNNDSRRFAPNTTRWRGGKAATAPTASLIFKVRRKEKMKRKTE
jgi:ribosomal protein L4